MKLTTSLLLVFTFLVTGADYYDPDVTKGVAWGFISGIYKADVEVRLIADPCGASEIVAKTYTNRDGFYIFGSLDKILYRVMPVDDNYTFHPESRFMDFRKFNVTVTDYVDGKPLF